MAQRAQVVVQEQGLFEKFVEALQFDVIAQKISTNKHVLIDIGLFGLIGLILGFFCKRYGEYIIVLAFFVLSLIVLHQFNFITVSFNTIKIQQMLGIPYMPMITGDTYLFLIWEWIKGHVPATISFVIGCLIGIRIG